MTAPSESGESASQAASDAGYAADAWPYVSMVVLLLVAGAALWTVVVVWTTILMHRPQRLSGGRALARLGRMTPEDADLSYEPVEFDAAGAGGVRLSGWWIPHPAGSAVRRTVVCVHSWGDSKVGLLAWARLWQWLGFHMLLLDMRAHGESGGRYSGGGRREADDLHAVIDALRLRHPVATSRLTLFGVSFGGLVAATVAAERDDLESVVIDSPVEAWETATGSFVQVAGVPLEHAQGLRLWLAERVLGVDLSPVRTSEGLARAGCRVLAILPQRDPFLKPSQREAIRHAVEGPGDGLGHVWEPDAEHNLALARCGDEYSEVMRRFASGEPTADGRQPTAGEGGSEARG